MDVTHLPVLVREVLELLEPGDDRVYVDATVGLGGHSEEMLKMIGPKGIVIGIDRDSEALRRTSERIEDNRLRLRQGSFSDIETVLSEEGINAIDGILFDLGVSMMQLKDPSRGFSFSSDERLDMRMDKTQPLSAWDVVNKYPEKELVRIIREYGEDYKAPRIARGIVWARERKRIDTCAELAETIARSAGWRDRIHPATRAFQALRIEVNRELDELKKALGSSLGLLNKGGRLCVISYHSLEDRIVKNFIRDNARDGRLKMLTKKPLVPGSDEQRTNPSSRSAKMRGAEKL